MKDYRTFKAHFVDMLFEEYKLKLLTEKLNAIGVSMEGLSINNYDIILDMIGFPNISANPRRWDREEDAENPDKPFFRDYLTDPYDVLLYQLTNKKDIIFTSHGLGLKESHEEAAVRAALDEHVDFIFAEYEKLQSN